MTYLSGGMVDVRKPYWTDVLSCNVRQNYNGSIYIIQGMQDWNVDPHMAFPAHQIVEAAGIDKTLAGQWAHDYQDRKSGHEHYHPVKVLKPIRTLFDGLG